MILELLKFVPLLLIALFLVFVYYFVKVSKKIGDEEAFPMLGIFSTVFIVFPLLAFSLSQ